MKRRLFSGFKDLWKFIKKEGRGEATPEINKIEKKVKTPSPPLEKQPELEKTVQKQPVTPRASKPLKKDKGVDFDEDTHGKIKTKSDGEIWNHFLKQSGSIKGSGIKTKVSKDISFEEELDNYLPLESKEDDIKHGKGPTKYHKKSKREKAPKATLDLHGKTVPEALGKINSFFINSRRKEILNVLVIVGKGLHSDEGKGVLKEAVLRWLNSEGKKHVSSYRFAPARLGGSGAIIVKLKR